MAKSKPKPKSPFTGAGESSRSAPGTRSSLTRKKKATSSSTTKAEAGVSLRQRPRSHGLPPDHKGWRASRRMAWDGNAEMDAAQGRGWAVLKGDKLHGMIFFHGGDDSEFVAKKAGKTNGRKGK